MPPSLTFSFRGETLASRPFRELAKIQRAEGGERILLKLDENESELSLPGGLGMYISTASIRFAKLAGSIFVESEDPIRVEEDGGRSFTFEGRRGFRTRFSIVRGGFRISVSDFFYLNPVEVLSLGNGESQPLVEVSGDGSIGGGEASVTIHTDKGEFRSVKRMDGSSICIQSDQIGRGEEIPVKVDVQLDATLSEIDRDAESPDSKADGRTVYSVGFNVKATDSARVIKDILLDFIPRWVKTIEGDDLVLELTRDLAVFMDGSYADLYFEEALNVMKDVYENISKEGMEYARSSTSRATKTDYQRLRCVEDMKSEGANCLDACVLFAACLCRLGIDPIIRISDGHATVGMVTDCEVCSIHSDNRPEDSRESSMKVNAIVDGRLQEIQVRAVMVDPTSGIHNGAIAQTDFDKAIVKGDIPRLGKAEASLVGWMIRNETR